MKAQSIAIMRCDADAPGAKAVSATHRKTGRVVGVYVRAELVDGDPATALDNYRPKRGETILNTVPVSLNE